MSDFSALVLISSEPLPLGDTVEGPLVGLPKNSSMFSYEDEISRPTSKVGLMVSSL